MSNWIIYYNPKCGTCRNTLELLRGKKIEPRIVEYLKTPPTLIELQAIAKKLGERWGEMIRTKEPLYEELHLDVGKKSQTELLQAIVEHPILLQRPIVVKDSIAIVARPPEKVLALV